MENKKLNERITIQFGESRKKVYSDFMSVVKEDNIPKSTAGYLLLQKGILHRNNPEPLVIPKPKVVIKKEVVYRDRPVEKVVYRDRSEKEHLTDRIVDIPKPKPKGIQTTQQDNSSNGSNTGKWVGGSLLVGVVGYILYKVFTV